MRWVKLTLVPPVRARWLLRIIRLTSRSLAGTVRTDVAVGTPRLASMFWTIRADAPRSTLGASPSSTRGAGANSLLVSAAGDAAAVLAASTWSRSLAAGGDTACSPSARSLGELPSLASARSGRRTGAEVGVVACAGPSMRSKNARQASPTALGFSR
jgi:hypothetical protein